MSQHSGLDCIIIGYNELPFAEYERFLIGYGEDSEAYRDLKFSFVNVAGQKLDYTNLLNHVLRQAAKLPGNGNGNADLKSGEIPNLAAAYLTNYLRRRGYEATYINLFQYEKDRLSELLDRNPLCVAITTTFYVVNLPVQGMVEFIRQRNPDVKIVVGGPLIANHARNAHGPAFKTALDDLGADIYVIEGQGELTLSQIVDYLKNEGNLSAIPNIAYYEGGELLRTKVVPENNSLDEELVDWRGFPDKALGPTIQTRTARSCAFKCSFCNYPARAGALTLASLESVEKELDSMLELQNVQNVVFIDDTFNVPFPRFKELCRLMIKKKYPFNWFSYFRCSNSDEEAIQLMAESGCKGVFLGIESGSPTILKNMNKAASVDSYRRGIEQLRRYKIMTFASFIIGFPGETDETVRETIDFVKKNRPDYYRAQMWYCEPGTPIIDQRSKYAIDGEGFVWRHATMDSLEAMDHIEAMFLEIKESVWMPQWSFDFWIVPYLLGKGITLDQLKDFMTLAQQILALEIASVPALQKKTLQEQYMRGLESRVSNWAVS
jgi:radical SAM PhpK family P-methyltransferase